MKATLDLSLKHLEKFSDANLIKVLLPKSIEDMLLLVGMIVA